MPDQMTLDRAQSLSERQSTRIFERLSAPHPVQSDALSPVRAISGTGGHIYVPELAQNVREALSRLQSVMSREDD